ncbi:Hypothetical protein NGAL_HAMBI1189_48030 [Neorhizobium galegae bv. officinalis]|uniref:Uncharacterized protein n=2 Tax=Neorhizobium galegae TaxID=399 RepID=A0A0T7H0P1_NEOGA|nr:Hypothetical protein NGAL_HAMBI1189_48030 [Neorhizobium galegae bv. officinalis]
MHRRLLVDEDTVIDLMAQAALNQHMIDLLATYLLRTFHPDSHKAWLDDLEKAFAEPVGLPSGATEHQAVLLSDVAVHIHERGRQLVGRLRGNMEADRAADRLGVRGS